jgi:outer membrane protein OmpA-like peptidoglycan-associated protein
MVSLRVARACDAAWTDMAPVSGGRHCASCDKRVHDLTLVSEARASAVAWLYGSSGGLCARVRANDDGFARFLLARSRDRGSPSHAPRISAALALALLAPLGACSSAPTIATEAPAHPAPSETGRPEDAGSCPGSPIGDVAAKIALGPSTSAAASAAPTALQRAQILTVTQGEIDVMREPQFAAGSATFEESSRPILDETAKLLAGRPDIRLVHVIGHTDDREPDAAGLSLKRAEAVVAYLVKLGVSAGRLVAESKGSADPLVPNDGDASRARNRRVELRVDEGLARERDVQPSIR